jgi:hypothetical protein
VVVEGGGVGVGVRKYGNVNWNCATVDSMAMVRNCTRIQLLRSIFFLYTFGRMHKIYFFSAQNKWRDFK